MSNRDPGFGTAFTAALGAELIVAIFVFIGAAVLAGPIATTIGGMLP